MYNCTRKSSIEKVNGALYGCSATHLGIGWSGGPPPFIRLVSSRLVGTDPNFPCVQFWNIAHLLLALQIVSVFCCFLTYLTFDAQLRSVNAFSRFLVSILGLACNMQAVSLTIIAYLHFLRGVVYIKLSSIF